MGDYTLREMWPSNSEVKPDTDAYLGFVVARLAAEVRWIDEHDQPWERHVVAEAYARALPSRQRVAVMAALAADAPRLRPGR